MINELNFSVYTAPSGRAVTHFCDYVLLGFNTTGGSCCIDFTWHPIVAGMRYLLPAGHSVLVPNGVELFVESFTICDTLHAASIGIFRRYFLRDKHVHRFDETSTHTKPSTVCDCDSTCEKLFDGEASCKNASTVDYYLCLANSFKAIIATRDSDLLKFSVGDFANNLHCHERTLRRACQAIFGLCPGEIIRYYILGSAARLLLVSHKSVQSIAGELGFANSSKLSRFMLSKIAINPTHFRRQADLLNPVDKMVSS